MNHELVTQAATAIYSSIVLLLIWFLVAFLWRDYRTQAFRQDLFRLRNMLFEYAKNGNVEFNSTTYRLFRTHVNALIRYAYHMTFASLVVSQVVRKIRRVEQSSPDLTVMIGADPSLSAEQKAHLSKLYFQLIWLSAIQVASTSIFAWPCLMVFIAYVRARSLMVSKGAMHMAEPVQLPSTMVRHVQYLESQAAFESEREKACVAGV
jgi:hypothetical protein